MHVNYPETIIKKSDGTNDAEAYLSRLCENTFLSFWSYPNVYRDQGRSNSKRSTAKGDGKELCDLLVIFENHIFIFSDKDCIFAESGDVSVNWSRWYKKAVLNSAKQIYGAERWIFEFPDSIYLDKDCEQAFPFAIPKKEDAIVHRIVVAHGASKACKKYYGGSGSLMLSSDISGSMHYDNNKYQCMPFTIGHVNPERGFIHIFDDITLGIVMQTLDTVADFTLYLSQKEKFFEKYDLITVTGEEELLACYLTNMDSDGNRWFVKEDADKATGITILEGHWANYCNHHSRKAQIEANKTSYFWDELTEKFLHHVTTGTLGYTSDPNISVQETIFKFLARENRTRRRALSDSLLDLLKSSSDDYKVSRVVLPSAFGEPCYLFLLLPYKPTYSTYEKYKVVRRKLLEDHLPIVKLHYPNVVDIIGIALEAGSSEYHSEDIIYLDARIWTEENNAYAKEIEDELTGKGLLSARTMFSQTIDEYPDIVDKRIFTTLKGRNRNEPCPCGSGRKYKKCCGR